MNKQLIEFARKTLKDGLSKCTAAERKVFARMYSHKDTSKDVNCIVDGMSPERIDWAMTQVQRTLDKK